MSIPALIVSGYLGAGKTTLINAFLKDPQGCRATVLVNDFGAINLDADLIENAHGDTIALTNGCACCAIGDDLLAAARKAAVGGPDLVIVEASGVAEPGRMAMLLRGVSGLRPAGIVTVVNGAAFDRNKTDKFISRLFLSQIASAHYLHVNRQGTDQASVWDVLGSTAPDADVIDGLGSIVHATQEYVSPVSLEEIRKPGFESIVLNPSSRLGLAQVEHILKQPTPPIERAKGLIETVEGRYWVDFVQGTFTARQAGEGMARWPYQLVAIATTKPPLQKLKEVLRQAVS
ncbi:MAG: CobW family GTP-binding protein [Pikeienuella sp.]